MEETKFFLRNAFLLLAAFQVVSSVDWLEKSKADLIALRNSLGSYQNQKADILFLIDTSGSLSGNDFNEEKRFVVNLLNEISVGFEATRVEVIPFGSSAGIFIDQISNPAQDKNKCSFNEKFNPMPQSIHGWMTNMRDAFRLAYDVCFGSLSGGKRDQVSSFRTIVILLTDGVWNYPWGDSSPVSVAQSLYNGGVEVLAIGVGRVNFGALQSLVKEPSQQAFYLRDFDQFSELATYIRGDPYEATWQTSNVDASKCDYNCYSQAKCTCGLVYGDYKCGCLKGWAGTGELCEQCPHSTYKDYDGYGLICYPCPANSGHSIIGSIQRSDCKCNTGYEGRPQDGDACTIRRCQALPSLTNGRLIGTCERDYGFTCKFACSEGYKLEGDAERTCTINNLNVMEWNGTTTVCSVIKCPLQQVPYADPQIGVCRDPAGVVVHDYVYKTKCTFECGRGYNMIGSPNITCQLDETWSPSLPVCEEVRCPSLPGVRMGTYIPASCETNTSLFDSSCKLECPQGYHINLGDNTLTEIVRRCYTNGSWDYRAQPPDCLDHQPPVVSCPAFRLFFDNNKGTNVSTVSWNFSFVDNSLQHMEPGVSVDDFKIELIINNKTYNSSLPKLLGIGANKVQYIVTDTSNNTDDTCVFEVRVRDTEPPICWFCPADISILNTTKDELRINWKQPNCTDNSGVPPIVEANKQSGELLDVGGSYVISYKYTDGDGNENSNCSFRITLEKKQCALYAPPKNGALACNTIGTDKSCTPYCKTGYDFAVTPPILYYCSAGEWNFWGFPGVQFSRDLPWPDCGASDNPSGFKAGMFAPFEFDGDCNNPNVQEALKTQFLLLLNGPFIPDLFCTNKPTQCNQTTIEIYCGELSAADKRRKRSTTKQVTFHYDYIDTDAGLTPGTTDQAGQDAFNNEKSTKQSDIDAVQAGFDSVNWVEFKAQSNLTILNNDGSNIQLSPLDAYCAEDGSVVRKCEQSDLNCFIEEDQDRSCPCNKKDGSITKCTRCPVGTYYDKGADDCLLCPEGTYNDIEGTLYACSPCPEGTWTYGDRKENFTSCTDECGPGLYSTTGIAKCFRCPAGTFSSGERNRECTECPAGTSTVIDAAPGVEDCGMQCAPGTYSDNGVEPCLPCPVGTYQPGTGQKSCLPCPGQESTHGTGASSDSFCGEVDTCISSPCMNGGTCVNTKESYRCDCARGFNGANCENDINECLLSPCYGGATCLNKINDFACLCNADYTGKKCELSHSICTQRQPCQNSVGCIDKLGTFECQCTEGYGETFCELDLDECASSPCQNNGVCISGLDSYSCHCPAGFSGVNCQIDVDECESNPCQNNGTCTDGLSSYTCQCPTGYSGVNCEATIDHCIGQPCKNGGSCVNSPTGYSCVCAPSYHKCRCTEELSSDYDLSFQVRAVKSYSQLKKPVPDLTAFTIAFWMRTTDTNPGTPISYATIDGNVVQDNALAFQDYATFNLIVNNISVFTGLRANDGQWHHVAVTWVSSTGAWHTYKDGALAKSSTVAFRQGEVIKGGGILIVGQEQDELGGGFNTEENFIGDISQLNIWDYALSPTDITNIAYSCEHVKGNVAAWGDFRESLRGDYIATTTSYACDFSNDFRKFIATYKRQIAGNDELTLSNTTPESCASSCLAQANFICRSFDFDNSTNTCYLSSKSTVNKTLDNSNANYNYYELNCLKAFGVSTERQISDDNMTASSAKDSVSVAPNGRLNQQRIQSQDGTITEDGAWSPSSDDTDKWLQIKFDAVKQISGVATQGHSAEARWVTSYNLEYSTDGSTWTTYPSTLTGNNDQNTIVRNEVNIFQAQYLRFRPQAYNTEIAMRVEVYGCPAPFTKPADGTDECSSSPCINGGICLNLYDDYFCTCATGYVGKNCEQMADCAPLGAPIHGTKSTSGSTITFSCDAGYSLSGSSSRTCQQGSWTGSHPKCSDTDECATNPCNQGCTNTPGSYVCYCNKGYELQQGSNTCVDIDECAHSNGGCSHLCHNSVGSYSCSCPSGLVLESIGQRSCKDVDECTSSNGGCVHLCVNTFQSYYCACRQGYTLGADQKSCTAISCPALGTPANGALSLSSGLVLSSTAMYSCNNGFRPTHSTDRVCQADGQWSGTEPSCIRVYCEEIGQVEHATRVLTGTEGILSVTGTTATFTCAANYAIVGDSVRTCLGDGIWSGVQPRCIASFCDPVPVPENGAVQGYRYELGATLRISCDEGHDLVPASSSFRTCNFDSQGGGTWSGQDPTCELVDCGDPGDPYGGHRHIDPDTKYQSTVTYTCEPQHHLEGETSQECLRNGSWSGSKPVCLVRSCGNPGTPEQGAKYGMSYKYGDTVTFSCNTGYTLMGSASRTCQESDALWTGTQPTCQIVDCGDPGTPANGEKYGDTFTYQGVVQFECHPQFKLTGDLSRTCQANGLWSGSLPSCVDTSCGTFRIGPTGTVTSTNYPNHYDNNEYCTWEIRVPVDKKVRLDFTEFKTETGKDFLFIYDTNELTPTIYFDGTSYRPPSFTSSGNVVRVRFISDEATTMKGFSFDYKQVDTDCGGVIKGGEGILSSPGYPAGYASNLDCVWLLYRVGETVDFIFSDFNTEASYDVVKITSGRFGETTETGGWGGLSIPRGSFYTDSYLWMQFTTDNIVKDSKHYTGWSGRYAKYWPYVNKKKREIADSVE